MQDNNYCVYVHKNAVTGNIFYVGSGRLSRASTTTGRSKAWWDVVKEDNFTWEIIEKNLDKVDSFKKEHEYYLKLIEVFSLVNACEPTQLNSYPVEDIFNKLEYDETSPTCLKWKVDSFGGKNHKSKLITKGTPAGSISKDNYSVVYISGRTLQSHRVVWILNHNEIDKDMVVDHIDGNIINNKISNLRLVPAKKNLRNRSISKTNKSGVLGVNLNIRKNHSPRWRAFYYDLNGKQIWSTFSVSKYGKEEAFRLACEWRAARIKELNEQGAGYTERHGT